MKFAHGFGTPHPNPFFVTYRAKKKKDKEGADISINILITLKPGVILQIAFSFFFFLSRALGTIFLTDCPQ